MRRIIRTLGTLMIVGGLATLAWAVTVWRWEDPLTSAYTAYEQRQLTRGLDERFAAFDRSPRSDGVAVRAEDLAAEARRLRGQTSKGDAIGRLVIPRLDLDMVFVFGTDTESLKRGPGLDPRTKLPGQDRLVYVAGHRTTYSAPFSRIDALRKGDEVRAEMPYGTFTYEVTGHRIVEATDLSVLRSKPFEQIALQACHPRFFASHRWIAYGKLVKAETPNGEDVLAAG
jgi:sortase A